MSSACASQLGPFKDDEAKEAANAAFVRIMRAWETLSDPDKRRCAKLDWCSLLCAKLFRFYFFYV
jgi:hypothetical protein